MVINSKMKKTQIFKATVFLVLGLMASWSHAQTMKWVPMEASMARGDCAIQTGAKQSLLCYALEYTPAVSGVLTSYTTGFFVSCTSAGSPIAKNQSCVMGNNVNLRDGCKDNGVVLINSSGNTGTSTNNKVQAGVPVVLHQVCFSVPYGESITIREDKITDLTTSIDISNGVFQTEYPVCSDVTIRRDKYDVSNPLWLDFKVISAGDLVSQLDWSTTKEKDNSHFIIERSSDGNEFAEIGRVDAVDEPGSINSYQFFDQSAFPGKNHYRIQQISNDGKPVSSPVRSVTFETKSFSVKVSPNPADEFISVNIQSPVAVRIIKLIDAAGRVVMEEKNENIHLNSRLDVQNLNPGLYTLVVETDLDKYTEKVVIDH